MQKLYVKVTYIVIIVMSFWIFYWQEKIYDGEGGC